MILTERDIFLHVKRSFDLFQKANETFEVYLNKKLPPKSQEYYQARNLLKEGQAYFDEVLKRAKQLLAPLPAYSSEDLKQQRAQVLAENEIIVRGLSLDELKKELTSDKFLGTIMTQVEISSYLEKSFLEQSSGLRKLPNIKVRMMLDKLNALRAKGQKLQLSAQKYFQSG